MRHKTLDGLRGLFLLSMALTHFSLVLGDRFGALNLNRLAWFDAAQGFIFLSGLVVGMAYGRRLLTFGVASMARSIRARAKKIYLVHAVLVAGLLVAALALPEPFVPAPLADVRDMPVALVALQLTFLGSAPHMSILPLYVVFVAVTPLILLMARAGHAKTVLILSLGAWMTAQTGLFGAAEAAAETATGGGLPLGLYFNLAGWQLLYVTGVLLGFSAERGTLPPEAWTSRSMRAGFFAVLVVAAGLIGLRTVFSLEPVLPALSARFAEMYQRQSFALPYAVSFATFAFATAYLLIAGRRVHDGPIGWIAFLGAWVLRQTPLVRLGRASLPIFALHIVLTYAIDAIVQGWSIGSAGRACLLLLAMAALCLPAVTRRLSGRQEAMRVRAAALVG